MKRLVLVSVLLLLVAHLPAQDVIYLNRETNQEEQEYEHMLLNFTFLPSISLDGNQRPRRPRINHVSINLLVGYAAKLQGVEFAGWANIETEEVLGFQSAGLINLVGGNAVGAQFAGVGNALAGDLRGVQVAGVMNVVKQHANGIQFAGALNLAGKSSYGQFSGVVNLSRNVTGFQIGVVNVARHVRGVQLGIVNVVEDIQGVPIGLLSFVKNVPPRLVFWVDEQGQQQLALRTGIRTLYSLLVVSADLSRPSPMLTGAGMGVQLPLGKLFTSLDVMQLNQLAWNDTTWGFRLESTTESTTHFRLQAGVELFSRLAFTGGFTLRWDEIVDAYRSGARLEPRLIAGLEWALAPVRTATR